MAEAVNGHAQAATPYDRSFYAQTGSGSRASAAVVLPIVCNWLKPRSIVDVGCGEGHWLAAARDTGIQDCTGLDGEYVNRTRLAIPADHFIPTDLSKPFSLTRRFDLAMSLEVAEHLNPEVAETFVRSIVALAPAVLFSAATPGQGGTDHRNERWPSYWASLFERHGYGCFDVVRPLIWHDKRVEVWYRQNALLFLASGHSAAVETLRLPSRPLDALHPELAELHTGAMRHRLYWAQNPGIRESSRGLTKALFRHFRGRASP